MAKLSYNPIFTNVNKIDEYGTYTGIQIASKLNQKNGQDYPLIDAIDIDWDGAWLSRINTYINTSYDLLSILDQKVSLEDLSWLNENVNTILNDYISHSSLEQTLENYQVKLRPGNNITISESNIISTYGFMTIDEANDRYTLTTDFESFRKYVTDRMFDYQQDERYNNLEKIYEWIISLERYIPVDYEDIDLNNNPYYFIYNSETNEYVHINPDYIISNPDEQYYIAKEITDDISDLFERLENMESKVGGKVYDAETDTYTYTGILKDINDLYVQSSTLSLNISNLLIRTSNIEERAINALSRSNIAYNMAYSAYLLSEDTRGMINETKEKADNAYEMAYYSKEAVGNPYSSAYYTTITEEDREKLLEDPTSVEVYIYFPGDEEPTRVAFSETATVEYYKYVPEEEARGMYKSIDDISYAAYNSLFNLSTSYVGSSYISLSISPDVNDGTNKRNIELSTTESIIDIDTGYIYQNGLVTTYSLYNTISYHSYIIDIPGNNDEIDGLILRN